MIEVLDPGPLTTVQDRGRRGWAHVGVPPSGAVDGPALELGRRLVGNAPDAAALEATLRGPRLRFDAPALVAITGARGPATVDGAAAAPGRAFEIAAGAILELGAYVHGARAYVSVRGGIDAAVVLGSRSTDLLTGLGPPPLRTGDIVAIGNATGDAAEPGSAIPPERMNEAVLRLLLGPRDDRLTGAALETLATATWRVTPAANRIGVRLEGPPLELAETAELPSEGVVTGALQVPPSGKPILLLNDHPTTGGYPVVGVLSGDDLPLAGQLRPGATLRFELSG